MSDQPETPPGAVNDQVAQSLALIQAGMSPDAVLILALQSMAQAAGLAMISAVDAQANTRPITLSAVTMACQGLLDMDFRPSANQT